MVAPAAATAKVDAVKDSWDDDEDTAPAAPIVAAAPTRTKAERKELRERKRALLVWRARRVADQLACSDASAAERRPSLARRVWRKCVQCGSGAFVLLDDDVSLRVSGSRRRPRRLSMQLRPAPRALLGACAARGLIRRETDDKISLSLCLSLRRLCSGEAGLANLSDDASALVRKLSVFVGAALVVDASDGACANSDRRFAACLVTLTPGLCLLFNCFKSFWLIRYIYMCA